jgi:hypothetical protein
MTSVKEFESFVRKENKTWGAKKGFNDDRVMAIIWALVVLKKDIAERYFDIEEYDEAGSPIKISDPNQYLANASLKSGFSEPKKIRDIGGSGLTVIFDFGQTPNKSINMRAYVTDVADGGWTFL